MLQRERDTEVRFAHRRGAQNDNQLFIPFQIPRLSGVCRPHRHLPCLLHHHPLHLLRLPGLHHRPRNFHRLGVNVFAELSGVVALLFEKPGLFHF